MDKVILKFLSDVMYLRSVISIREYEAIMDCCTPSDLDNVFEKMMKEEYVVYERRNE